jgi:hypothetical protein
MNYFILHVLHKPEFLEEVLHEWKSCGVKGVTVLQSIGLGQLEESAILREDLPLLPTLASLFETGESLNRTLFTVVEGEDIMEKVIAATQEVVGDLNQHNTGILVVLPVLKAFGLNRNDLEQ